MNYTSTELASLKELIRLSKENLSKSDMIIKEGDAFNPLMTSVIELNATIRNLVEHLDGKLEDKKSFQEQVIIDYLLSQTNPEFVEEDDVVYLCDNEGGLQEEGWCIECPKEIFSYECMSDGSPDAIETLVTFDDDDFNLSKKEMLRAIRYDLSKCTLVNENYQPNILG